MPTVYTMEVEVAVIRSGRWERGLVPYAAAVTYDSQRVNEVGYAEEVARKLAQAVGSKAFLDGDSWLIKRAERETAAPGYDPIHQQDLK
jgi:hypothetical protein